MENGNLIYYDNTNRFLMTIKPPKRKQKKEKKHIDMKATLPKIKDNKALTKKEDNPKITKSEKHSNNKKNIINNSKISINLPNFNIDKSQIPPEHLKNLENLLLNLSNTDKLLKYKLTALDSMMLNIKEILSKKYEIYEIDILTSAFQELCKNFETSVNNELENAKLQLENNKLKQLNYKYNQNYTKEQSVANNLKLENKTINNSILNHAAEINLLNKQILDLKTANKDLQSKIIILERRIEIILEPADQIIPKEDILRTTLSEVLKENEKLKQEIIQKTKEINKLKDDKSQMQVNITRLSKKLNDLKQDNNNNGIKIDNESLKNAKEKNLIKMTGLPNDLKFRDLNFKEEYKSQLFGLYDSGTSSFATYLLTSKDESLNKQGILNNILTHLIGFKELGNCVNSLINFFLNTSNIDNIYDIITQSSIKFKGIYNSSVFQVWKVDYFNSLFYTVNNTFKRHEILCNKGLISELFKLKEPIYKKTFKEFCLYKYLNGNKEYVNNVLLFPIIIDNKLDSVIEIRSIDEYKLNDCQYFSIVYSYLYKLTIDKYKIINSYKYINNNFLDFNNLFIDLSLKKNNLYDFSNVVYNFVESFFVCNNVKLFFYEGNNMLLYNDITPVVFSSDIGLVGYVCSTLKPYINIDYNTCNIFNNKIDIQSLLPVITFPIIDKNKLICVIQLVINQKNYNYSNHLKEYNISYEFQKKLQIINDIIIKVLSSQCEINFSPKEIIEPNIIIRKDTEDNIMIDKEEINDNSIIN